MAKTKKSYKYTKVPFKPFEGSKEDDQHVRITKDMMMHENYINLSPNAKTLYNYIKLWANRQYEFTYPISVANKIMARATATKAKKELIDRGFLIMTQQNQFNGKMNTYRFSERWFTLKPKTKDREKIKGSGRKKQ